jgi:hypothetical protein
VVGTNIEGDTEKSNTELLENVADSTIFKHDIRVENITV